MDHIKIDNSKSSIDKYPKMADSKPSLRGFYVASCAYGFDTGSKVGAYVGGFVGTAIPASTPVVFAYGLLRVGRTLLRK
jgi:hypothetical protein